jgi:hypothetical protein
MNQDFLFVQEFLTKYIHTFFILNSPDFLFVTTRKMSESFVIQVMRSNPKDSEKVNGNLLL